MTTIPHDTEIAEVFRFELSEMLDALAGLLEHMETASAEARMRDIHAAFRIMHTMKGAAGVVGADSIATLAHAAEDALGRFRDRGIAPSSDDIALLAETLPVIEGLAASALDEAAIEPYVARFNAAYRDDAQDVARAPQEVSDAAAPSLFTHGAKEARAVEPPVTDAFVRVDVQRLDRLLARVGELLPLQARFLSYVDELDGIVQSMGTDSDESSIDVADVRRRAGLLLQRYAADARRFARSADDIVDTTKRVRMLPLSTQASHWNRLVHEAARTLGKHVHLDVDVGDIELDKRVFDTLRDPFFHILRNAVDHGIEAPAARQAAGKSEHGRILISARVVATMIDIEISDDGRGVDVAAIRERALRAGFIAPEQAAALTPEQTAALIFQPGLSTAEFVSTISGRGVGLDAVRQTVRDLGGSVDVVPPILGGTTFRIRVPVTIALLRGLLVRIDNQRVVLPIEHVVHARRTRVDAVRRVDTMFVFDTGDEPLRLHWSGSTNRKERHNGAETVTIVVVSHGDMRVGFVVDEIIGEQQFIARSLPWNLSHVPGISGVVILADGTVSTVLDVSWLFDSKSAVAKPIGTPGRTGAPSRIVVADDSMSIRTMMRNALEGAGYQVFLCSDGHDAWETLTSREADLLVSDINMPRIDGLELTRRVRANARLAHLPVVLVTSRERKEDLVAGAAAGANEYIVKSQLDQTKLLEAVARLV